MLWLRGTAITLFLCMACLPSCTSSQVINAPAAQQEGFNASNMSQPLLGAPQMLEEVELLRSALKREWSNRKIHEVKDGVNIARAFDELRASIQSSNPSLANYAHFLEAALAKLADGHIKLAETPGVIRNQFHSGLRFLDTTEGLVVVAVDEGRYPAVERGAFLESINGLSAANALMSLALRAGSTPVQRRRFGILSLEHRHTFGEALPPSLKLKLLGQSQEVVLAWQRVGEGSIPMYATARTLKPSGCVSAEVLPSGIGLLQSNTFSCNSQVRFNRELNHSLEQLKSAKEVILDLRANGGGGDEQSFRLAASLFDKPFEMYGIRHADSLFHGKIHRAVVRPKEYKQPFLRQPVKALVGPDCYSACDVFAWTLKKTQRAEVVGTSTSGGAGCSVPIVRSSSRPPPTGCVQNFLLTRR